MNEEQHYSMVIEWSDEDQVYLVILPEWTDRIIGGPAVSHGKTYEEAVRRGHEALEALIASTLKHGEALPSPRVYANA